MSWSVCVCSAVEILIQILIAIVSITSASSLSGSWWTWFIGQETPRTDFQYITQQTCTFKAVLSFYNWPNDISLDLWKQNWSTVRKSRENILFLWANNLLSLCFIGLSESDLGYSVFRLATGWHLGVTCVFFFFSCFFFSQCPRCWLKEIFVMLLLFQSFANQSVLV